nr:hypothetical protein [Lysobacter solisilvae]
MNSLKRSTSKVHEGELALRVAPQLRDRVLEAVAQIHAVGQPGEGVVHHLVLELGFDALAHFDLLPQFARALQHALFQLDVEPVQCLGLRATQQGVGDLVGDEGQQFGVAGVVQQVGAVALHRHHADHAVGAAQRHAQPALRQLAVGARVVEVAGGDHFLHQGLVGQQRGAGPDDVLAQAARERARLVAFDLGVDVVREFQHRAVVGDQGDVEVVGVEQLADRLVDAAVEALGALFVVGQRGDAVQRGLQVLCALALADLLLQHAVGVGQLARAVLHAPFQFLPALLALHRVEHVLGDEGQHRAVGGRVALALAIGLHDQRAHCLAGTDHRHADEVHRGRAQADAAGHGQDLGHLARGAVDDAAVADQAQGQAVAHLRGGQVLLGVVHARVFVIGEVHEAQRVAFGRVERDVEILGVHQLADDVVQALEQAGHVAVGAGHVRDGEQRALQLLGAGRHRDRAAQAEQGGQLGQPALGQGGQADLRGSERGQGTAVQGDQFRPSLLLAVMQFEHAAGGHSRMGCARDGAGGHEPDGALAVQGDGHVRQPVAGQAADQRLAHFLGRLPAQDGHGVLGQRRGGRLVAIEGRIRALEREARVSSESTLGGHCSSRRG